MSEVATKLLEQVLALPENEQAMIAERLRENLGIDDPVDPSDDPEFRAELERRLNAVANGTAVLIDGEQVFREARERLKNRRQP